MYSERKQVSNFLHLAMITNFIKLRWKQIISRKFFTWFIFEYFVSYGQESHIPVFNFDTRILLLYSSVKNVLNMNEHTKETRLMKEQSFSKPFYLTTIDSKRIIEKQPSEVFYQKTFLKNFAIVTGKHLCWSLCLIKLQAICERLVVFFAESFSQI